MSFRYGLSAFLTLFFALTTASTAIAAPLNCAAFGPPGLERSPTAIALENARSSPYLMTAQALRASGTPFPVPSSLSTMLARSNFLRLLPGGTVLTERLRAVHASVDMLATRVLGSGDEITALPVDDFIFLQALRALILHGGFASGFDLLAQLRAHDVEAHGMDVRMLESLGRALDTLGDALNRLRDNHVVYVDEDGRIQMAFYRFNRDRGEGAAYGFSRMVNVLVNWRATRARLGRSAPAATAEEGLVAQAFLWSYAHGDLPGLGMVVDAIRVMAEGGSSDVIKPWLVNAGVRAFAEIQRTPATFAGVLREAIERREGVGELLNLVYQSARSGNATDLANMATLLFPAGSTRYPSLRDLARASAAAQASWPMTTRTELTETVFALYLVSRIQHARLAFARSPRDEAVFMRQAAQATELLAAFPARGSLMADIDLGDLATRFRDLPRGDGFGRDVDYRGLFRWMAADSPAPMARFLRDLAQAPAPRPRWMP